MSNLDYVLGQTYEGCSFKWDYDQVFIAYTGDDILQVFRDKELAINTIEYHLGNLYPFEVVNEGSGNRMFWYSKGKYKARLETHTIGYKMVEVDS